MKTIIAIIMVCRPICGLEPASVIGGVPTYAHNTGEVNYRRRAPLQLASTLGFVLNKNSGAFMNLTPQETDALHECLVWGRQEGNNKCLEFFGTNYETFQSACSSLMSKITSVIPEGCPRARIRSTRRESRHPKEGELGETLAEEAIGMVVVDAGGHPLKYDALTVMDNRLTKYCSCFQNRIAEFDFYLASIHIFVFLTLHVVLLHLFNLLYRNPLSLRSRFGLIYLVPMDRAGGGRMRRLIYRKSWTTQ